VVAPSRMVQEYGFSYRRSKSKTQKSSTEAQLVGTDDAMTMILWTRLFLEEQCYKVSRNVIYQDNKSAILLETNCKRSSSKRIRAINFRFFFIADQVEKGNIEIKFCRTNQMIGEIFTKALQGKKSLLFRDLVLGKTRDNNRLSVFS
jgi:hypothetical protein